jgi:hypothetical protein
LGESSEVLDYGFCSDSEFVADLVAAWVSGVAYHPDYGDLDDLIDVTGT